MSECRRNRSSYTHDKCRCDFCVTANRTYSRDRRRALSRPDEVWNPRSCATSAATVLRDLLAAGHSLRTVAYGANLDRKTVARLYHEESSVVSAATLTKLSDLLSQTVATWDIGTCRNVLSALATAGYTASDIAELGGLRDGTRIRLRGNSVSRSTAMAVRRAADAAGTEVAANGVVLFNGLPPQSRVDLEKALTQLAA